MPHHALAANLSTAIAAVAPTLWPAMTLHVLGDMHLGTQENFWRSSCEYRPTWRVRLRCRWIGHDTCDISLPGRSVWVHTDTCCRCIHYAPIHTACTHVCTCSCTLPLRVVQDHTWPKTYTFASSHTCSPPPPLCQACIPSYSTTLLFATPRPHRGRLSMDQDREQTGRVTQTKM